MKEVKIYYYRLGIIRIVSCLLVLLYHLNIIPGGYLAVCTFFTLSGYLSCVSSLKSKNFSIKNYYKNILLKIYLPLITVVFLTLIVFKQFNNITWLNLKPETLSVLFGYNNFWQLVAKLDYFARHINSPFMHLWYIAILLQFDLLFPLVFKLFKKLDDKINKNLSLILVSFLTLLSTLLFVYLSISKDIMIVYYNTFARRFSLLFGVLFALIQSKRNKKINKFIKKINRVIYGIFLLILITLCIIVPDTSKYFYLYMIIATILSVELIKYSTITYSKNNIINNTVKKFSLATYEIYLVQYPVIFFVEYLVVKDNLKLLIIFVSTIIVSYILHFILNIFTKKIIIRIIKIILLCCIIFPGIYILITEKDNTKEMKELENLLNSNLKLIEERNNNFENNLNKEQEEWNKVLDNMKSEEDNVANQIKQIQVVGIGDSVLLGAIDEFYKTFPNGYFDGKVSRSIIGAEDLLVSLKNSGKLSNTLILALANNGDYSDRVNKGLMNIVGNREIYWVSAVKADDPKFNTRFKQFAASYPNIHIVEWEEASKNHPEYFYADGIHLKDPGKVAYVKTIYDTIYNNYLNELKNKQNETIKQHEEELKQKITFYGNDALTYSFNYLKDKFENSNFNIKKDYKFDSLYKDLSEKINNETLEYKIVLLFDKESSLNKNEYNKIIDLCKDHKIYIINLTNEELNFENNLVKVIDFYKEIKNNKEYLAVDKVHLSSKGNEKLTEIIVSNIEAI